MIQHNRVLTIRATAQSIRLNTWLQFSALLFSLLNTQQALSQNETSSSCVPGPNKAEICSVQVVDPDGTKRLYRYEIKRAAPGSPTIVNLPGGPGGSSIGKFKGNVTGEPADFGYIAIDPRGVGVKDYGLDPQGQIYSQQRIVQDIVAVLDKEKPSQYIIYGYSHGSVLATELAAEVTKEGSKTQKPAAVLIGGVFSKALTTVHDYTDGFNKELNRIMASVNDEQRQVLRERLGRMRDLHLNGSDTALARFLMAMLYTASPMDVPYSIDVQKWIQTLANPATPESVVQFEIGNKLKKMREFAGSIFKENRQHSMPVVVGCQELGFDNVTFDFDLERLQIGLIDRPSENCKAQGYRLKKPFDSKNFQIRQVPVIYVQGSADPATPAAGAKEHYNNQTEAPKIYIEIQNFAHLGLIPLDHCPDFWNAITQDISTIKSNVEICQIKFRFLKILGVQGKARSSHGSTAAEQASGAQ